MKENDNQYFVKSGISPDHFLFGSQKVQGSVIIFNLLQHSTRYVCVLLLMLVLIPLSLRAQYYDLSVGVERHMRMCYGMNVICPLTSDKSETAIEKIIDEIEIDGKVYAIVVFIGWSGTDEYGNIQQTVSDTTFYRMDESILYEYVGGKDVALFDFGFTVGDSLKSIVAPYVNTEELWMTYHIDQQSIATFVLGDSLFHFPDGIDRNIILGDDIIVTLEGDTLLLGPIEFIIEDSLPRPEYGYRSPFMYIEGMGVMLTAPTHRNKIICGFRDAAGNHFGCTAPWFTSIENSNGSLPQSFEILGNYPNPFNPSTTINYHLHKHGELKISLYNSLGMFVGILKNNVTPAGRHSMVLDMNSYASGVYIVMFEFEQEIQIHTVVLIK